ncbi:MAG: NAD-dependent epimerase/dehydratase family protein [Aeromicrobium sp.]
MARVLMTGAAGFIGSHVSEVLVTQGWQVRGLDAFTDNYDPAAKVRNVAALQKLPAFELVAADLVDADLSGVLDGVDAVIHLAAEPGVSTSWGAGFDVYVRRNVLATQRLLEAVAAAGIPRLVYASSSSVYGPTNEAVDESARLAPLSPYGVSKLAGECLVGAYAHERGLNAVSLRFFSVYGPRQRPDMAAHRFIEALLDGSHVEVYGDRLQMRDFTFVDDVAAAVSSALTAEFPSGTILNIANGTPVGVPDLLRLIGEQLGTELSVRRLPHRVGDTRKTHGDSSAASRVLDWHATTDLKTGLARQVAWHLEERLARTSAEPAPASAGRAAVVSEVA